MHRRVWAITTLITVLIVAFPLTASAYEVKGVGYYKSHPDDPAWSSLPSGQATPYFFPVYAHLTIGELLREPARGDELLLAEKQRLTMIFNWINGAPLTEAHLAANDLMIFSLLSASYGDEVDLLAVCEARILFESFNGGSPDEDECMRYY